MSELNEKQKAFCREYIIDNNATQAAIRAGYSKRSAEACASRLLTKDKIKEHVEELRKKATKNSRGAEWVIEQLERVVLMGLGDEEQPVVTKEGQGGGITTTSSQKLRKADLVAAKGALDLLGKYHGIFSESHKVEHSGSIMKRIINVNTTKKDDK